MAITDIIEDWLFERDRGLVNPGVCGCWHEDLAPCGDGPFKECTVATRRPVTERDLEFDPDTFADCAVGDWWYEPEE